MTGNLIMGGFKMREVGDPEDEQDVIYKRYFMNTLLQNKPYYFIKIYCIPGPHTDETKTFFTAGKGKGIDLDSDKVFEIFNGNVHGIEIM